MGVRTPRGLWTLCGTSHIAVSIHCTICVVSWAQGRWHQCPWGSIVFVALTRTARANMDLLPCSQLASMSDEDSDCSLTDADHDDAGIDVPALFAAVPLPQSDPPDCTSLKTSPEREADNDVPKDLSHEPHAGSTRRRIPQGTPPTAIRFHAQESALGRGGVRPDSVQKPRWAQCPLPHGTRTRTCWRGLRRHGRSVRRTPVRSSAL